MNNAPLEVKVDWGLLDVGFHSAKYDGRISHYRSSWRWDWPRSDE